MKFIAFLLLFPFICLAQNFELKMPDKAKIENWVRENKSEMTVYAYLQLNYKATSDKMNIKYEDYSDETFICSFNQYFEHNISYEEDGCGEDAGILVLITFPKTTKANLIKWIEAMNKYDGDLGDNKWNEDKTAYEPDGAGCYYSIKDANDKWIVEIFCSC